MIENKIWGTEINITNSKKILVANKPLSVQRHRIKTEIWYALSDKVYLTIDDNFVILNKGETIKIENGKLHCLLFGVVAEEVDAEDGTERVFDWCRVRTNEKDYGK